MSGLEVAGLVLGAVPLLLHATDKLKDSFRAAIRSRTYINKLTLALLLQQSILIEVVRSLLINGGYEDLWRLDDDPVGCLKDPEARECISGLLGPAKNVAFTEVLNQTQLAVKEVAKHISGLLPASTVSDIICSPALQELLIMAIKAPTDDLLAIIEANTEPTTKSVIWRSQFKLLFRARELKAAIDEIDQTTNALQRFARIISLNKPRTIDAPTKRAERLAKGLRHVRGFANNLYLALLRGWRYSCHDMHEANLYLDDRIDSVAEILQYRQKQLWVPSLVFQLTLTAFENRRQALYHQASIKVLNDAEHDDDDSKSRSYSQNPLASVPSVVTDVEDICTTIIEMAEDEKHKVLVLAAYQQLGIAPKSDTDEIADTSCTYFGTMRLREVLSSKASIPLKFRSFLAIRLSSNLLQLSQTPWLEDGPFEDSILFPATSVISDGNSNLNYDHPLVSVKFTPKGTRNRSLAGAHPNAKKIILELGIILLELWHEQTLEDKFSQGKPLKGYFTRREFASRWIDDMTNPLPPLYDKAVCHCVGGMVGGDGRLEWEDTKFWNAYCTDIIEPLRKNCEQWIERPS